MKDFLEKHWISIIIFIVIFLFSLTFPYTGDDLAWSLNDLSLNSYIDIIKNPGLNGRHLGNLSVLFMTRNKLFRGLVVAIVLTGIISLIKKETKVSHSLIILLLIIMPIEVFAQGVVWASGFANYAISTYLLLLSLMRTRDIYNKEFDFKNSLVNLILFIASSLFIENVTVFLLGFTLILNITYFIKNKKINWNLVMCLAGSLIGTTLMFIQPAYRNVLTSKDTYRTIELGFSSTIEKVFKNYNSTIYKYVAFFNVGLIIVLNALLIFYYKKHKKDYSQNKRDILNINFTISIIYSTYALLYRILVSTKDHSITAPDLINAPLTLIYLIIFIVEIYMLFYKKKTFWKLMTPILIIIGLVAPLTIVTPIGSRNFLLIYVLETIEVIYIFKEADIKLEKYKYLPLVILFCILGTYTYIYCSISSASGERDKYVTYIANETTKEVIKVPMLPYSKFVHFPNYGIDKYWKKVYEDYLGIRHDLDYVYIPYKNWNRIIENDKHK